MTEASCDKGKELETRKLQPDVTCNAAIPLSDVIDRTAQFTLVCVFAFLLHCSNVCVGENSKHFLWILLCRGSRLPFLQNVTC